MKMTHLILLAVLLAPASLTAIAQGNKMDKPNKVFILADDINRDTWGVFGTIGQMER